MRISLSVYNETFVNTSRGSNVFTWCAETGRIRDAVIDTLRNEPDIHLGFVAESFWVWNPSYSRVFNWRKVNATRMALEDFVTSSYTNDFKMVPPALPYMDYSSDPERGFSTGVWSDSWQWCIETASRRFEHLRGIIHWRRNFFLP